MAYKLTDFADIYEAIAAELKLQLSDTTSLNRIKRVINMVYLDEVAPRARWWWLQGHASIKHKISYSDGTCAVTPNTTTVTISVAPSVTVGDNGSFVGWYFSIDGQNEIYRISDHVAEAATFELETPYNGNLVTNVAYKIYQENIPLPLDCRETVEIYYDHMATPLVGKGLQEFRKIQTGAPKTIGRPNFYCTYDFQDPTPNTVETEADRYRVLKVWPAISQYTTILKVDYIKEVLALELDGDEPLMPVEDRIVLYYGALSILWSSIGRNPEESARNKALYEDKIARMMGKITDSMDKPRVEPDSSYVVSKRGPRIGRYGRAFAGPGSSGGSTYNAPSYLENVTINGATITANVGVNPGVTIDGRDLSADGLALDSHIASIGDVHGAVGGIVGLDNAQVLTNKMIDASDNTISNIADSSISASAAISTSKLAPLTANKALTTGSSGLLEVSATTASELAQLAGISSNVQTQLNANSTAISDHITDTSAAHSASSVSNVPSGNLAATDVQGALNELQSDIDTRATSSALSAHTANTSNPHSVTKAQVGLSNVDNTSDATKNAAAVVLTNKDIDGGTASDTSRITLPKAAKTTLDALTRKQGTLVYDTTTNKPYYDDGTFLKVIGSGSGGSINFISGGDAESGTTGITPYNEGSSASRPSVGTGTAPTGITIGTDSTNPLSGTNSFILSKSAVNARGQGYSWSFTIDRAYQAKVLKIEMDYVVSSGSFVAGSPTTDSDLIVYIIDVDSGQAIEPSSFKLLSNSTTISDRFSATFQTSATSLNYRLCLHVANNTTNTWQIKFDNLAVSPSNYVYGTPITDWTSYTPTYTNAPTGTSAFKWRRIGDSIQIDGTFVATGSGPAGTFTISLPSGLEVDTTKIAGLYTAQGVAKLFDSGVNKYTGVSNWSTSPKGITIQLDSAVNVVQGTAFTVNDSVSINIMLPILGWSSSVQVSDGYDGRVIAANVFRATGTASQSIPNATYTGVGFDNKNFDTTSNWVTSATGNSSYFVAPSAGYYRVSASVTFSANATGSRILAVCKTTGAGVIEHLDTKAGISGTLTLSGSRTIYANAGELIFISAYQNSGAALNLDQFWNEASIEKLSGNPVISATETVAARYTTASGQAINNGAEAVINFDTKVYDTHGAVTVGASWVFKAPTEGLYAVDVGTGSPAAANVFAANNVWQHILRKNQTGQYSYPGAFSVQASGSQSLQVNGSDTVYLLAGETIDLAVYNNTGVNRTLLTNAAANYISIRKVK